MVIKRIMLFVSSCAVLIGLDQLSKWWALVNLMDSDKVLTKNITLSFAWNRGISWSFFSETSATGNMILSGFIAAVIMIFGTYAVIRFFHNHKSFAEIMVLSGAISNFIDRLVHGAVIDFIDVHYAAWHWPTFNIADSLVVVGVCGILMKHFFYEDN